MYIPCASHVHPLYTAIGWRQQGCWRLARGRALLCDCAKRTVVTRRTLSEAEALKEIERFDAAVSEAEGKLLEVQV